MFIHIFLCSVCQLHVVLVVLEDRLQCFGPVLFSIFLQSQDLSHYQDSCPIYGIQPCSIYKGGLRSFYPPIFRIGFLEFLFRFELARRKKIFGEYERRNSDLSYFLSFKTKSPLEVQTQRSLKRVFATLGLFFASKDLDCLWLQNFERSLESVVAMLIENRFISDFEMIV